MTALPPLVSVVDHWVQGWAANRDMPVARTDDGWRIDVRNETRDVEYVALRPGSATVRRLAEIVDGDPRGWVSVVDGDVDRLRTAHPGLRMLAADEEVMVLPHLAVGPHPDTVVAADDPHRATATVTVDSVPAASGTAAIVDDAVVFDRIQTFPDFRRRGFGRQIMSALTGWAIENGAATGALAATVAGQGLYRSLGWDAAAPLVTLCGQQP